MKLVADFETTSAKQYDIDGYTRVWGFGVMDLWDESQVYYGTTIEEFIDFLDFGKSSDVYFHNLAFDGMFIIDHLLRSGWKHVEDRGDLKAKTFTTLIGEAGEFYMIDICFYNKSRNIVKTTLYDSLKIIPMAVADIPKAFGFDEVKGDLDYNAYRGLDHKLTEDEKYYIYHDLLLVAKALRFLFVKGMDRMTTSSNALNYYKESLGKNEFSYLYPKLSDEIDKFCRGSYKGGFTYLNPKYAMKDIGGGIAYDVNSLYPSVMLNEYLPIGQPVWFNGEYEYDEDYPLYIIQFRCRFELREGYLPTIQIKNNPFFSNTEYLTDDGGEDVVLTLTSIDFEMFLKHYDVHIDTFFGGYKFMKGRGMFNDYINTWNKVKVDSRVEGNKGMDTLAKLMLNSLYGKFGTNPRSDSKIPFLDKEKDVVRFEYKIADDREPIYVPIASFITAHARAKTIGGAQANYDRFIYADTDSIHLEGKEEGKGIEIHPTKIGAWGIDYEFKRARYMKQKTYLLETDDGEYKTGVAGMRKDIQHKIDFENFYVGQEFSGALTKRTVKGGVVLYESTHTLK